MLRFAKAVDSFRTSEIRDLMSVAIRPDIISFAGGMPGNDLFPIKEIEELYNTLTLEQKQTAFQYGPTPGYPPLLESLREYLRAKGFDVENNRILITTGSLQAIYILTKIFVDPEDVVLTENPSFIGALSAFRSFRAHIHGIPLREDGIDCNQLNDFCATTQEKPKFLYITPNFHNPAGILYSTDCRRHVAELAGLHDIPILEDDAYGELYFDEATKPIVTPLKVLYDTHCTICYTGSFSKILGPGFRLGWMLVPHEIYQKAELCKQSIDACSPNYTQVLADAFLRSGNLATYGASLRQIYKRRRDRMIDAMKHFFPPEVQWNEPKGGFYIWCSVPASLDMTLLLKRTMERGAIFVVGSTFDPAGNDMTHFRLAFSHTPESHIERGIQIIGDTLHELLREK